MLNAGLCVRAKSGLHITSTNQSTWLSCLVSWNALTNLNLNDWAKRADIVAEICIQRSISPLDRWRQA